MKKYNIYVIGIALLSAWVLPSFSQVSNDNEDEVNKVDSRFAAQDYVPGQVLVKFKDANRVTVRRSQGRFASTSIDRVTAILQKYGTDEMEQLLPNQNPNRQMRRSKAYSGEFIQERDLSQLYCLKLSADHQQETEMMVGELNALDEVEYAEPNYKTYMMADSHIADSYNGNPMESQQWYLDAYGVKELWNKPIINKERPIIAILDTGVDLTHPDLKDNLWTNTSEVYGTKDNDNDGNGFKNDVHGWDFIRNSPNIRDNNMHGTHVAGIAAAVNNGIGIIGANPQALIMPITVLQSDGAGDVATIVKGIDYAIANGATVLNMSLGTYVNSHALRQALESAYTKAVLVAAAGNDNKCVYESHSHIPSPQPCFPAAYSFVLGVQATVKGGSIAPYSNYDDDGCIFSCESSFFDPDGFNYELKAPGSNILSTIPGGSYKQLNGTSMAAPLASGAISALIMVKQYDTQEILWGDLLHTNNVAEAFQLKDHSAELELQRIVLRDRKELPEVTEDDYCGNNEVNAGEIVHIYPVIRSTFSAANNIKLKLMLDEFENPDAVEIISGEVDFGIQLGTFGRAVSRNPLVVKISNKIPSAYHIMLKIMATCDDIIEEEVFPFSLVAYNVNKLSGLINENTVLTADHVYYISGNLGVNKGVTLTIEPGARIEFAKGSSLVAFGKLIAKGTPEKPIIFTGHAGSWNGIFGHKSEGEHKHHGLYTNNDSTLFTLLPTELTPEKISEILRILYYQPKGEVPTKNFYLYDYMGRDGWIDLTPNFTGKEHLFTDPNYLTPAVRRLLDDFNAYCSRFSPIKTETHTASKSIKADIMREWATYDNTRDTISYCRIEDCVFSGKASSLPIICMFDCVLDNCQGFGNGARITYTNGKVSIYDPNPSLGNSVKQSNFVNNQINSPSTRYSWLYENNYFNNFYSSNSQSYTLGIESNTPIIDRSTLPSYLGTSREDLVRPYIYESSNTDKTWGIIDLSNMPSEPIREAHGIVWKVLVNGKDAQDEFEDMTPLGIGKHKFEVYFNRPMNKDVAPQISFGIRSPYNQQNVEEDGNWNADGTIYTAYKTITGKTLSDGLNGIYVYGAEDDEHFPCPVEKNRFNFVLQAAGSMATGFMAEEGLGCVKLKWDKSSNEQEAALGYNVYRYHQITLPAGWRNGSWHDEELVNDTIRLNEKIIDLGTTTLTDFDVTPGVTYYYYYNVLGTDLQTFDMSNVVVATPLTSTRGDANGSGNVDVADVITTVNYITLQNPKPFIFEAADMNEDNIINILDVMGIVKGILNPSLLASSLTEASAAYTIENGTLYVESDAALGGVQVQLAISEKGKVNREFATAPDLDGFETASAWLSDNDYLLLAYSLNGKALNPGKHALLYIGDAEITSLRLSDVYGKNVTINNGEDTTDIDRMGKHVMNVAGVYDLQGRKLSTITPLKKGIYIINGKKVVK